MSGASALKWIITIAGSIIFAWFFLPPIYTGNFHIGAYTGSGIGAVLVLYGVFFFKVNALIARIWQFLVGKVVLLFIGLCLAVIIGFAAACIFSMAGAGNKEYKEDATVVVLGCHVYSYGPSLTLKGRLDTALEFLQAHPGSSCIVCGGQGKNEPMTEASAMYEYLAGKGIDPSRLYMDDTSRDTIENLSNALDIIGSEKLNSDIVIVTNDYHMYRAQRYAASIGFESPGAVGSSTLWWLFPGLTVREMYGIMEMWLVNGL